MVQTGDDEVNHINHAGFVKGFGVLFFLLLSIKFSFVLTSSEGDRRKDLRLFDFIIPLCVGHSFRRERREVQTPPLCEFRLAVESYYMGFFWCRPLEQTSRAVLHKP